MIGQTGDCPFLPTDAALELWGHKVEGVTERRRRRGRNSAGGGGGGGREGGGGGVGGGRGGRWKLGVAGAKTSAVFLLLSILLQMCRCQRDTEYLNPNTDLPPHFLETPVKVVAREGSMAILPCSVQYLGSAQVAWRRVDEVGKHFLTLGNFKWMKDEDILLEHGQDPGYVSHWNLLLKDVHRNQSGRYECQITTKEKLVRIVTLEVTKPLFKEPGKMFVNLGDPIHLTCNASGGAQIPEDIDWFKDGSKIDTRRQSRVLITKFRSIEQQAFISELIVDRSREEDKGTYICRSSAEKIDSLIVNILVSEKPNVGKRDDKQGSTSENQVDGSSSASRSSSSSYSAWLVSWVTSLWILGLVRRLT